MTPAPIYTAKTATTSPPTPALTPASIYTPTTATTSRSTPPPSCTPHGIIKMERRHPAGN